MTGEDLIRAGFSIVETGGNAPHSLGSSLDREGEPALQEALGLVTEGVMFLLDPLLRKEGLAEVFADFQGRVSFGKVSTILREGILPVVLAAGIAWERHQQDNQDSEWWKYDWSLGTLDNDGRALGEV